MSLPRPNPYAASLAPSQAPSSASASFSDRRSGYPFPSSPGGPYGGRNVSAHSSGSSGFKPGRLLKRLFKFPQMDFEVAVWEMVNLMAAPKKVWRQVWYRKQTKNTYASSDPAFPYLLSFFLLLTSLAWSLAYAEPSFANVVKIAFWFIFVHFLGACLVTATFMWLLVPRAMGPGGFLVNLGMGGRRRGLFGLESTADGGERVEWGFAFDVAVRSFLPTWVYLYVLQFLLLPAVTSKHWPSTLLTNAMHLLSFAHSAYVSFLGYNSISTLKSTQLLLAPPVAVAIVLFIILTAVSWNASLHLAPILWCSGGLRRVVGGS